MEAHVEEKDGDTPSLPLHSQAGMARLLRVVNESTTRDTK